jgi:hypothetical protein
MFLMLIINHFSYLDKVPQLESHIFLVDRSYLHDIKSIKY